MSEEPEDIVARIAPYAALFHRCLRIAIARANAVFVERAGVFRLYDPLLFAYHVRWELKQLLATELPPGTPLAIDDRPAMSAVVVRLGDIELRFRKSEPGEVPPAGRSTRMQMWYAQTLDGSVSHNLLMLWHVDPSREYVGLDVAFPAGGTAYSPFVRWVAPLPEAVEAPADDLDIALPQRADDADAQHSSP